MKIFLAENEKKLLCDFLNLPNSYYNFIKNVKEIKLQIIRGGDIELTEKQFWFINNQLKRLDKNYKLEEKYIPLYGKFVVDNLKGVMQ